MKVEATALPGVLRITPSVFRDDRGFFLEWFNAGAFAAAGLPTAFVQDNHSRSAAGVVRGLHYQLVQPQGKLVRVIEAKFSTSQSTSDAVPELSACGKACT